MKQLHPLDSPLPQQIEEWEEKYNAPEGQIWVCGACGKSNNNRTRFKDVSCFMNAVLCWEKEKFGEPWVKVEEEANDR